MTLPAIGIIVLQALATALLAPLTVGFIRSFKAKFQNRQGASPLQPYYALFAMARKEMTIPEHSSWVFRFVPYAVLAATFILALIVPTFAIGAWNVAATNMFLAVSIAALGAVFMVLGGMDTGSTFGNMGSSREMTLASLAEPAFFVVLATLGYLAGSGSLDAILAFFAQTNWARIEAVAFPTLAALLMIVLSENARYPVDNPATHLELTMVHEGMLLEYSGPLLVALEYAAALRLSVMGIFFMNLVLPFGLVTPAASLLQVMFGMVAFLAKLVLFALVVSGIESLIVKMRFYRMQEYFALVFLLALAGVAAAFVGVHFLS